MKKQRGIITAFVMLMIAFMAFLYLINKDNAEQCNRIGKVYIQGKCE